jgi:hypothetical protein
MDQAQIRQLEARQRSSTYMDEKRAHRVRDALPIGALVFVHDTSLDKLWLKRTQDR